MKALLIEGLNDACRNIGSALGLFWPLLAMVVLIYGVSFLLATAWFSAETAASGWVVAAALTGFFIVLVYLFFILCQGAVGWHRRVLLNEAPGWISPIPKRRSLKYALAASLFILMFLIAHMIIGSFLLPIVAQWMVPMMQEVDPAGTVPDQLDAMWKIMLPMQIGMFVWSVVIFSLVLWLARSWLLVFPHISIRTVQPAYGKIKDRLDIPPGLVSALLVVYFLPSVIALVYMAVVPFRVQMSPWVAAATTIVQIALSVLTFLWGLSILSKAYAMAAADKVLYEKIEDGAPA
ncbi:hypothetical protein [Taklimakanibacter lacteus]|uniref:hypothetical protein n=1 Tax=Taklimakanibacter lacteus TaxID=2268456 RepID=UPI000E670D74